MTDTSLEWKIGRLRRQIGNYSTEDFESCIIAVCDAAERLRAINADLLLNLQEMHILHYGDSAALADQRERWNGLSTYEIAATLDHDARAAIAKAKSA